ncbi:MAG: plasmid pRiA4b ORF-3 family protein [Acidobacteriota bacterium]|nr:plasmid pRiA4b ORF-3 family protein [Acidobacteriota bacterium]
MDFQREDELILKVKVSLVGVTGPPVWRRVLVPEATRLDRVHDVIQAAMGWKDSHLHLFTAGSVQYGPTDPELELRDERSVTIGELLRVPGEDIRYTYDLGDDWEHSVVLEERLLHDPAEIYPTCLDGRGACPPEDCGGPWGLARLRGAGEAGAAGALRGDREEFDVDRACEALAFFSAVP